MLSIILVTIRDINAISKIFITSNPEAELIIIDSRWSEEKKQQLKGIKHSFKQVVYAPSKPREDKGYLHDAMNAANTGFAYAEEDWLMRIDDNWELHPDFFDRVYEMIRQPLHPRIVIRPVEIEEDCGETKWNYPYLTGSRFENLPGPSKGRWPIQTIGQAVYHRYAMYEFNGWDEEYDKGFGWADNDVFLRFNKASYEMWLDQQLMCFRYKHVSTAPENRPMAREIFKRKAVEMDRGMLKTSNDFDLLELHKKMIKDKPRYVI